MDTINEKMPGEYFWGVFIPGAFTSAVFYYTSTLFIPSVVTLKPTNTIILTILFVGIAYITGLMIMQLATALERKYHLRGSSYFPFVTLLENRRFALWLELFNRKSFENFGFYIKKTENHSDSQLNRINTQSFFLYCRYLVDKNNLGQKPLNLQAEYYLFRNIAVAMLFAVVLCLVVIMARLLRPHILSNPNSLKTGYPVLIIASVFLLLAGIYFFRTGIRKRFKYTEEVYRTAFYLMKGI